MRWVLLLSVLVGHTRSLPPAHPCSQNRATPIPRAHSDDTQGPVSYLRLST
jgi:hypothetical protein